MHALRVRTRDFLDQVPGPVRAPVVDQSHITSRRDDLRFFEPGDVGEQARERVLNAGLLVVAGNDKRDGGRFDGRHDQATGAWNSPIMSHNHVKKVRRGSVYKAFTAPHSLTVSETRLFLPEGLRSPPVRAWSDRGEPGLQSQCRAGRRAKSLHS